MGTRNKSCDIEELDRNRSPSIYAAAVIGFASVRQVESCASAVNLQIPNGALRVDGCETAGVSKQSRAVELGRPHGKLPGAEISALSFRQCIVALTNFGCGVRKTVGSIRTVHHQLKT